MPEYEPQDPSLPPPTPPRPFFLKRAWVGWTVALLLAAGGGALAPWLVGEREDLSRELASTRRNIEFAQANVRDFQELVANQRRGRKEMRKAFGICSDAIEAQVDLIKFGIEYLDAFLVQNQGKIETELAAFRRHRKPSTGDVRQCERWVEKA